MTVEKTPLWFLISGSVFVIMAMAGSVLKRLPLSSAVVYLAVGIAIGPYGLSLLHPNVVEQAFLLEHLTEVVVIISLFSAGLKLRAPLQRAVWRPAVILATAGMLLTVGLVAAYGWLALGLPAGFAILLGGILAPTDPVLASDVQARDPLDQDRVRFGLTGEAGFNDGTAFPFVMLGLGLLGLHEIGSGGLRWVAVDLIWAVASGLAVGAASGALIARLVLYLRKTHKEAVGLDDFLAMGLIALSYGGAVAIKGYGFLAVFAAGLAMRREERRGTGKDEPTDMADIHVTKGDGEAATHPEKAPAYMAQAVLEFNEGAERVAEVALVVVVGSMLSTRLLTWGNAAFVAILLLLIRPLAVYAVLRRPMVTGYQRRMIAWFGIRGIGSVYYLAYALTHGLPGTPETRFLTDLTLATVAVSVVVHGVTVTPVMDRYTRRQQQRDMANNREWEGTVAAEQV